VGPNPNLTILEHHLVPDTTFKKRGIENKKSKPISEKDPEESILANVRSSK
jgi:hypothetical protein